jgi:tetratricopeptide (TPR) repeat protein
VTKFRIPRLLSFGLIILLSFPGQASAQTANPLTQARVFADSKQWDKAIPLFSQAYDAARGNLEVYEEYLSALLAGRDFKAAEQLVTNQQRYSNSPLLLVDLARVYAAWGKEKKATEQFDAVVQTANGDELLTQQLAAACSAAGRDDYAIKIYERTRTILQNPYLFNGTLTRLYAKAGDVDKAVDVLLSGGPSPFGGPDDTKATLLELLGNDPAKLQMAQKAIIRRINLQPENTYYADLLTWLYTQKNDWEGALIQIQAIDARTKSGGQELLQFSRLASREGQYDIALKSLDAIIEGGKDQAYYAVARAQRLSTVQRRLEENPTYTKEEVAALARAYADFLATFPEYNASDVVRDYATLEAQYNNNSAKAIELLQAAILQPSASREFIGRAKLQLGDFQILEGKVWEASLTYSQVDKAFREDMLGEEARFRNGKLAYYRGDFGWAQAQLSALKASTSELIANDALNLSVLITENTPDSNNTALLQFARADLFLFQNKHVEALKTLDSITTLYPKHPLQDDVLLLRASLAMKQHDYVQALGYLERIYKEYGKDVLADDALFKTADIYERALKKPEEAKKFFEQLIIDYPGSTYVQIARTRLQALAEGLPHT